MIDPHSVLDEAKEIIGERGQNYGGIEENFSNISTIVMSSTGIAPDPHDIAMVMVGVKLARIKQSPGKRDSYLDAINYLAFACELIEAK
jgi:hypothetical protein